jgi:NAD(P)-dependent dehydrogenase (short-subunit alcohol dehydrogenase family)
MSNSSTEPRSQRKVAVVTGAVSGLGAEVALRLAGLGFDLALINRSRAKTQPLLHRIAERHPGCSVDVFEADLADQDALRAAAMEVIKRYPRVDALFNVAGVLLGELVMSKHDNEMHFQVNALAPYMLMRLLRDPLARAPRPVILNVSSGAVNWAGRLDFASLRRPQKVTKLTGAYAQSKLALTTLTNALADEFARAGIVLRSMDPGPNKTPMTVGSGMPRILLLVRPFFFKSPEVGATDIVAAALDPKYGSRSGLFLAGRKERRPPSDSTNPDVQARLLQMCRSLTGV